MVAAFDYMDAEDTRDLRAATLAPTGLETLGTYAEELGPDAADIDPLDMFVEVPDEDDAEGAGRAAFPNRKESFEPSASARSSGAAPDMAELLHAIDTLVHEAELSQRYGAASILRHTRFAIEYGREAPGVSAKALRDIEASYRQEAHACKLRSDHGVIGSADFYGRAAAVIEDFAARGGTR